MADGLIAPGEVDERDIQDVAPSDLKGFTQCHFFAGIGVWSLALRQAGWPDDRPIWTGSCPCQPFSAAGKAGGFADERHLWPAFFHLIGECRPSIVVGEQVASKDGLAWLDLVSADMEGARYAFGAVDTCAAGFGAPHIRQRLYFGAKRLEHAAIDGRIERRAEPGERSALPGRGDVRLADALRSGAGNDAGESLGAQAALDGKDRSVSGERLRSRIQGASIGMADADDTRSQGRIERRHGAGERIARSSGLEREEPGRPGPTNGLWRNADWLFCRDGKWRPVEPATFPLADAGTFRNRVAELRGAGNAINLAQATGFIEAFRESIDDRRTFDLTVGNRESED